jgi:hypothetical protein
VLKTILPKLVTLCLLLSMTWPVIGEELLQPRDDWEPQQLTTDAFPGADHASPPVVFARTSGTDEHQISNCGMLASLKETEDEDDARLYLAKVLGVTFTNLKTSAIHNASGGNGVPPAWNAPISINGPLFTAAIAGGVRVPRSTGALRLEFEGALRDNFSQTVTTTGGSQISIRANDNWSALANAWRDFSISNRLNVYVGGGVGSGGYWLDASSPDGSFASNQTPVFVWQAGGGAAWRYNDWIDLAMSYRFLDFDPINASLVQPGVGSIGTISSKMTAGELFFMLRVYDPFQWRRHLCNRNFYLPN